MIWVPRGIVGKVGLPVDFFFFTFFLPPTEGSGCGRRWKEKRSVCLENFSNLFVVIRDKIIHQCLQKRKLGFSVNRSIYCAEEQFSVSTLIIVSVSVHFFSNSFP